MNKKIIHNGIEYNKIIFVCSANKYRSPALQYLFQEKCDVQCDSQGTMNKLNETRRQKSQMSKNKELLAWVNSITNENVKNKMLKHSQEKFKNSSDNLYIFISDKHLNKYACSEVNCISISYFIEKNKLDDPLVFIRTQKDTNVVWEDIEKIVESVILKIIK